MTDYEQLKKLEEKHPDLFIELNRMFGSEEIILKWLKTPKPMLRGKSPVSLLKTHPEQVVDYLYKIKTGDFS